MVVEVDTLPSLWAWLCEIKDPRRAAGRRFSLQSILSLIADMLCGKLYTRAIAQWGRRLSVEQLEPIGITREVLTEFSFKFYTFADIGQKL